MTEAEKEDPWKETKEAIGCITWIIAFFVLYLVLELGSDLVRYLQGVLT